MSLKSIQIDLGEISDSLESINLLARRKKTCTQWTVIFCKLISSLIDKHKTTSVEVPHPCPHFVVRAASALVAKFAAEFGLQYFGRVISVFVAKTATDHCGLESLETPSFGRESLDMPKFVHKSLGMPKICPEIQRHDFRTSTREQVLQMVQPVISATAKTNFLIEIFQIFIVFSVR